MIKILDNTKSLSALVTDKTNGLGQFEPVSCKLTEELNGVYEGELTLLTSDKHYSDLSVNSLIQMSVNQAEDLQIFRVYYVSKPINEVVTVKFQHITYDLSKVPVQPFTATGASSSVNKMVSNMMVNSPFTMTTDIANTQSTFTLDIPRSFRECLGGYQGSLLDVFVGEYEYDNLEVKMLSKRGADRGVRIAYGKNLTDLKQEENIQNVYTGVLGYAVINETTYTGTVYEKEDNLPTTADLTSKATTYATNNDIEVPNVSIDVSFVSLDQTDQYKDVAPLERVLLGDTVHVYFDKLGVEASARVIKTVWNVNLQKYDSIELGDAKANMNTVLNEIVQETNTNISSSQGFLTDQLNQMANLIINGLGLHMTKVSDGAGGYIIYLHNKETLASSDTQYVFGANGFLVSTDYGATWNAGFDSSGNAVLNSLATITLKALEIYGAYIEGTTMTFGDPDNYYITASTSNNSGVLFRGNGFISFDSTGRYLITNRDDSSNIVNQFSMSRSSTTSDFYLRNYYTSPHVYANTFSMQTNGSTYSNFALTNYTPAGNPASYINGMYDSSIQSCQMRANGINSTNTGASVQVRAESSGNSVALTANNSSSQVVRASITLNSSNGGVTIYSQDSSGNLVAGINFNATNGNVYITGSHLYFNGSQKW